MTKIISAALALVAIQFALGTTAEARHHHHHYRYCAGYGYPVYYGNAGYCGNTSYYGKGSGGWHHAYRGYNHQAAYNYGGRRWH